MGGCCGGEDEKSNISVGKKGTSNKQGNDFVEDSSNILDFVNDRVREIHSKEGDYKVKKNSGDSTKVKKLPIARLENNAKYDGEWNEEKNERHGYGIQVWSDGSMYQGYWKEDKANGWGRLIHADGDVYEGEWKDDKAHGQGVYKHTDGAEYNGDWKEDKQDGNGIETWPDGAKYDGTYVDGKKHGKGTFHWADGSEYSGQF